MKTLLEKYLPLRNAEGGGGAGGAAPPPASGGDGGQSNAGATPPQPPAGASPPAGGSATPPAAPYRPEGLPDTMFGASDKETIDKLKTAVDGYRQRDSTRGVPEAAEAYSQFKIEDMPENVRPHITELSKDPLFAAASKVAFDEKVPVGVMQKLTGALYSAAAEAGLLEPPVDVAAERTQLLPDSAKNMPKADQDKAIDARMQQNEDFVNLLAKPGADGKSQLDPKDAEHVKLMLMDSAAGNRFLELFRAGMTGANVDQPNAGGAAGAGGAGGDAKAQLRERAAQPDVTPGHPSFSQAKFDALQEDYKSVYGN